MAETDKQLVSNYINGDGKVLEELINRYLKPVYNFVYRISGNKQNAEDITQETFVKVWRKIKKYNPNKSFKTWLFTIAHNTAIDWLRKKRSPVFSDFENSEGENYLENELVDPNPLPDKILAQAEDKKFVENLLQQLAPIYREVLILKYTNDLSFEEIAEILAKPLDTVKSQHRRALIMLRKLLNAPKLGRDSYK